MRTYVSDDWMQTWRPAAAMPNHAPIVVNTQISCMAGALARLRHFLSTCTGRANVPAFRRLKHDTPLMQGDNIFAVLAGWRTVLLLSSVAAQGLVK